MVALNFQAQFADAVESGRKKCTIRAPRKDGREPRPGDKLQLYTGMRSKACRKLAETICAAVSPIEITSESITIAGVPSSVPGEIARRDGFETFTDMAKFFGDEHGLPFRGFLIEWR